MLGKVEKERDQGKPMANMKSMRTEMIKCFYNCVNFALDNMLLLE